MITLQTWVSYICTKRFLSIYWFYPEASLADATGVNKLISAHVCAFRHPYTFILYTCMDYIFVYMCICINDRAQVKVTIETAEEKLESSFKERVYAGLVRTFISLFEARKISGFNMKNSRGNLARLHKLKIETRNRNRVSLLLFLFRSQDRIRARKWGRKRLCTRVCMSIDVTQMQRRSAIGCQCSRGPTACKICLRR